MQPSRSSLDGRVLSNTTGFAQANRKPLFQSSMLLTGSRGLRPAGRTGFCWFKYAQLFYDFSLPDMYFSDEQNMALSRGSRFQDEPCIAVLGLQSLPLSALTGNCHDGLVGPESKRVESFLPFLFVFFGSLPCFPFRTTLHARACARTLHAKAQFRRKVCGRCPPTACTPELDFEQNCEDAPRKNTFSYIFIS